MNRTQYALEVLLNLSEYLKSQLETEEDRKIKSEIYTYLIFALHQDTLLKYVHD